MLLNFININEEPGKSFKRYRADIDPNSTEILRVLPLCLLQVGSLLQRGITSWRSQNSDIYNLLPFFKNQAGSKHNFGFKLFTHFYHASGIDFSGLTFQISNQNSLTTWIYSLISSWSVLVYFYYWSLSNNWFNIKAKKVFSKNN